MQELLIFHLDVSIFGGAERLLENMASAYKGSVSVVSMHAPKAPWPAHVRIITPPIPLPPLPRCVALSGMIRLLYLYLYALFLCWREHARYDVVLSDQLAFLNPLLRLMGRRLIFYCHFPEPLMPTTQISPFYYSWYRHVINWLDHIGIKYADLVICNSRYTLLNFLETYGPVHSPKILYPCVSRDVDADEDFDRKDLRHFLGPACQRAYWGEFMLSLNRFEPKKRHDRAIKAFFTYLSSSGENGRHKSCNLVCCGGLSAQDVAHLEGLRLLARTLARDHGLLCDACGDQHVVIFLTNCDDATRRRLLSSCAGCVYTPSNEHFGIVPLESMSYGKPVIAVDAGGPRETVTDQVTGFLIAEGAELEDQIAAKIGAIFASGATMAAACRAKAAEFSYDSFAANVARYIGEKV